MCSGSAQFDRPIKREKIKGKERGEWERGKRRTDGRTNRRYTTHLPFEREKVREYNEYTYTYTYVEWGGVSC